MPEATHNQINTKVIENNPPAKLLQEVIRPKSSLEKPPTYTKVQELIHNKLNATIKNNPNVPPFKIESMFYPIYGPLMLDEKTHLRGAETEQQKELSARIQHSTAKRILYATTDEASTTYTEHIYDWVKELQFFCEISDLGKSHNLLSFWNGVKAEIAIIRALEKDYTILLPDYTQDPTKTSAFNNEVLQWDVKSGVDLIAISKSNPSHAILIDAKGRKQADSQEEGEERDTVTITQQPVENVQSLNSCLRETLNECKIQTVDRAKIIIPTAGGFLGTVGNLPKRSPDDNHKQTLETLEQFTSLRSNLVDDMLRQIRNPQVAIAA